MVRIVPLPHVWEPLPAPLEAVGPRLRAILDSWARTPYMEGCQGKGQGVDCVRFVAAVLDELYGFRRVPTDRLPQDIALHRPRTARAAMRKILRVYEPNEEVRGVTLQPGDVVVVGEPSGGPGHAMIVGARKNTLWHATPAGVHRTGWGQYDGVAVVHHAFRLSDRHRWVEAGAAVAEVT